MAHLILTGATGTAGSAVLAYCLSSPAISKVSVLSRRPVKLAEGEAKARVIIHADYNNYPKEVLDELRGATGCIWAQGKSSTGMNESEYTVLTHDYPLAAAKAFATLGPGMNFIYVSGEGVDASGASRVMFSRVKGRAETDLLAAQADYPSLHVYNVRPSYIDPRGTSLADRPREKKELLYGIIAPVFRAFAPSLISPTDKLAEALVRLATGDGQPVPAGRGVEANGRTLRNTALRAMVGI